MRKREVKKNEVVEEVEGVEIRKSRIVEEIWAEERWRLRSIEGFEEKRWSFDLRE